MAFILFVASFLSENVTAGDAGRLLARIFAGALFISGLFVFLLGLSFVRGDSLRLEEYIIPICVGIVIGAIEAWLFLQPAGEWLWAPLLLLVFTLRPVRNMVGGAGRAR